jgi:predicted transcriptional regulator
MTSPVITINENASIEEAAKLMAKKKVKRLPVMNNEKLVGILTFTDIVFKVPTMLSILEEIVRPYHRKY